MRLTTLTAVAAVASWLGIAVSAMASGLGTIRQDVQRKTVTLTDGQADLTLRLNYNSECVLDQVSVRGRQVAAQSGVASGIRIGGQWYTTRAAIAVPKVVVGDNTVAVKDIEFGKPGFKVREAWLFTVLPDRIIWRITRRYPSDATIDDSAFPEWDFAAMSTWTGGLLGNGGVVWNKYLDTVNATYGARTGAVTFWNVNQNDCLRITSSVSKGCYRTVRFSHQPNNTFSCNYVVSDDELKPKHDLRRFLPDRQDLWVPFKVNAGEVSAEFTLQALDYDKAYNRGVFHGLDGGSIRELLNTVGRYGVIDTNLVGANGWRSGYICLHEQWFGEIGLALDDPGYNSNLAAALDYERDHAISPDGRVKARWAYNSGDAMPGTYDATGFYEAQWGYLMDSQPDYVMNVAELYSLTGDKHWLAGQKTACERALNYLMRREVKGTGLAAMMTDSRTQQKGSDWFDIVWASYENGLVNAELYEALNLWANEEEALGDHVHATDYRAFAARLKVSFNRPIGEGGFWDPANQRYVYWRDKDGSIHGDNLFTAVNFAAIGYGLCDDKARQKAILSRIELAMQKENLFLWPTNFYSFEPDEAAGSNFPFPKYENGDIFMSWGELGIRAYAAYDPATALKYVKKTLARYDADGLSYQRYERKSQAGAGDDILAGNCMTIVGLYRDIYGIQPQPNRLYLEPHLTGALNGTRLRYQLRGREYLIDLNTARYGITAAGCTLRDNAPFGMNASAAGLQFFPGRSAEWAMSIMPPKGQQITVQIASWPNNPNAARRWSESMPRVAGKTMHVVAQFRPHALYKLTVNGRAAGLLRADKSGRIRFASKRSDAAPQHFELRLAL